jgi:hypothetical protein
MLLGVGMLFPWNAFITAGDYFGSLYHTIPFPLVTVLPLAFNYPNIIFLLLNLFLLRKLSIRLFVNFRSSPSSCIFLSDGYRRHELYIDQLQSNICELTRVDVVAGV